MALPTNTEKQRGDKQAVRKAAEQDVFLREVDEAVRQERVSEIVQRYGWPIGIAIVLAFVAFAGWLYWNSRQEAKLEERSEQLVIAYDLLDAGRLEDADKALAPLADESDSSVAAVSASLARAGIALSEDRRDDAVRIYEAVIGNKSVAQIYRDLAAVRLSAAQFEEVEPQVVIDRLKHLAVPDNPWFGSSGELVAMAYLKQGRENLAGPLLVEITKNDEVPQSLRARTRQLAGVLGYDAIEDVDQALAELGEQKDEQILAPTQ